MLYEKYELRVAKVAKLLKFIIRHLTKIIVSASVVVATSITLVATKGIIVSAQNGPTEIEYGSEITYSANAFLSSVYYEYSLDGSGEWSTEAPRLPGTYKVRPVGTASFGGLRYGKEQSFKIVPKPLTVTVTSESLVYGESPEIAATLEYGDTFTCEDFVFDYDYDEVVANGDTATASSATVIVAEDGSVITHGAEALGAGSDGSSGTEDNVTYNLKAATVRPDANSFKIFDKDGNDVTSSYDITFEPKYIPMSMRPLEIRFDSADKSYDGTPLSAENYEIISGTLAYEDSITLMENYLSVTNIGKYINCPDFDIFTIEGTQIGAGKYNNYSIKIIAGSLNIDSVKVNITTNDGEFLYDGKDHTVPDFTVEGPLAPTDKVVITDSKVVRDHGTVENEFEFKIVNEKGEDITSNYVIEQKYGTLIVNKRKITVSTSDGTWTYDAAAHTSEGFEITGDGLAPGHTLKTPIYPSIYHVGTLTNSFVVTVLSEDGEDVTDNYDISYDWGTLEVTRRSITIYTPDDQWIYDGKDHSNTELHFGEDSLPGTDRVVITDYAIIRNVGTEQNLIALYIEGDDEAHRNVSDNYDITFVYGDLTVTKRALDISSGSESWIYDGKYHDLIGVSVNNTLEYEGMAPGHKIEADAWKSLLGVKSIENSFEFIITDEDGNTISKDNYEITVTFGTITVEHRKIDVLTGTESWVYDGTDHYNEDITVTGLGLAEDHYVTIVGRTLVKHVTTEDNVLTFTIHDKDGNDVTANYDINTTCGTLVISQREITVTSSDNSWLYDATVHAYPEYTVGGEGLAPDSDEIRISEYANITDVGTCENKLTFRIYNALGEDVTEDYSIDYSSGTLEILIRSVELTTSSDSKIYDGTPLTNDLIHETEDSENLLVDGHTAYLELTGTITKVGSVVNTYNKGVAIVIRDKNGNDVTKNYNVTDILEGTLEITKRNITIFTPDHEWVYADTLFVGKEYYVMNTEENEGLAPSEKISDSDWATIINAGNCKNTFSYVILAADGVSDVTENYAITEQFGTLTVTRREITIETGTGSWVYDGAVHEIKDPTVTNTDEDEGLVPGHYIDPYEWATIKNVGIIDNFCYYVIRNKDGGEVDLANYDITYIEGELEITKRSITIISEDQTWIYDDTDHSYEKIEPIVNTEDGGLAPGQTLTTKDWATIREAGSCKNTFSYAIYDSDGVTEVTDNYEVTYIYGDLTVEKRKIDISSLDKEWTYNDSYYSHPEISYTETAEGVGLVPSHEIITSDFASIKNAGECENTFSFTIVNKDGEDVTGNYEYTVSYGTLIVNKKDIVITSETVSQVYDGLTHIFDQITIEGIVDGHTVITSDWKEFKDATPAPIDNEFSYVILGKDGLDSDDDGVLIEDNYNVVIKTGTVQIRKRTVEILTSSDSWVYDASAHWNESFKVISKDGIVDFHTTSIDGRTEVTYVTDPENPAQNILNIRIFDENGVDVTETNYEVFISYGTLNITRRQITVTTHDLGQVYDGMTYDMKEYTVGGEGLAGLDNIRIDSYTEITNVEIKDNILSITILDAQGNDVTENYDIDYVWGKLEILKRSVELTTSSDSKIYDGTPLTNDIVHETDETEYTLVQGHKAILTVTGSIIKVGTASNTFEYGTLKIVDERGRDVTANYDVVRILEGTLEILKRGITVTVTDHETIYNGTYQSSDAFTLTIGSYAEGESGTAIGVPSFKTAGEYENIFTIRIANGDGEDTTDNYEIEYVAGKFVINKREITISTEGDEWVYNNTVYSKHEFDVTNTEKDEGLADGHYVFDDAWASIIKVDSVINSFDIVIRDANHEDVTENYEITRKFGTLTVTKRHITVQVSDFTTVYNGKEQYSGAFTLTGGTTFARDESGLAITPPGFIDAGEHVNMFEIEISNEIGEETTGNYEITYKSGKLVINKREITISTSGFEWIYDNTVYYKHEFDITNTDENEGLAEGHAVSDSEWADIITVGDKSNSFKIAILDAEGNDVTENYNITEVFGTLTVTKRHITVQVSDFTTVYNGKEQYSGAFTLTSGGYAYGENGTSVNLPGFIDAGEHDNLFEISITNGDGDTTENYDITYVSGKFTINKRTVVIISSSDEKFYDGTPLTNETITEIKELGAIDGVEYYFIVDGHRLVAVASGSQTEIGSSKNLVDVDNDVRIYSGDDDVTANYDFHVIEGDLVVNRRPILVVSSDEEKTYDGTPLLKHIANVYVNEDEDQLDILEGHKIVYTFTGTITDYIAEGTPNYFTARIYAGGVDVTDYYDIDYTYGTLMIEQRSISVISASGSKDFDGEDIYIPELYINTSVSEYDLVEGHKLYASGFIFFKFPGTSPNYYDEGSVRIEDANGEDKTHNYHINDYNTGTLTINPLPTIVITTGSAEKVYDGTPLTMTEEGTYRYEIRDGRLGERVTVELVVTGTITDVLFDRSHNVIGQDNTVNVIIKNKNGDDLTDVFIQGECLKYELGTLTVTPRDLTVSSGGGEWEYDAKEHYSQEITYEGLADGQSINAYDFPIIKNAGEIDNTFGFSIESIGGGTVKLSNYNVTTIYGKLTVKQREITVVFDDYTAVYNGYEHFSDSHDPGNIVSGHSIVIDEWTLVRDATAEPVLNELEFHIEDENGEDVTSNYALTIDFGTIEITKLPVKFIGVNHVFNYNGKDQRHLGYELAEGCDLAGTDDHKIDPDSVNYFKNVGTYENVFAVIIRNQDGINVNHNYDITYEYGTVTIKPRRVTVTTGSADKYYDGEELTSTEINIDRLVSGHVITAVPYGTQLEPDESKNTLTLDDVVITDENGEDVTYNYEIKIEEGTLIVNKRQLTVASGSAEKIYDGTPLSNSLYFIDEDSVCDLLPGHKLTAETYESQTNVGAITNTIRNIRITDAEGNDVTKYYDVSEKNGLLNVTPREIYIESASDEWYYDTTSHKAPYIYVQENSPNELVAGHYFEIGEQHFASITEPGEKANEFYPSELIIRDASGKDVTENYIFESEHSPVYGTLRVIKPEIVITSGSATEIYNGKELVCDEYVMVPADPFPEGFTYDIDVTGSITNVARDEFGNVVGVKNTITIKIFDADGNDVTDAYINMIQLVDGTLTVTPIPIEITTDSDKFEYDGNPHSLPSYSITGGSLLSGHNISDSKIFTQKTDAGIYDNEVTPVFVDENGEDVTGNYEITAINGTIEITKRPITVFTGDIGGKYTGKEYKSAVGDLHVTNGELVPGHAFEIYGETKRIDAGEETNVLKVKVKEDKTDVTKNYDIAYEYGTISIDKLVIYITSATTDQPLKYDGTPKSDKNIYLTADSPDRFPDNAYYQITATFPEGYTAIGEYENVYDTESVRITLEGEDVTHNFDIQRMDFGTVRISDYVVIRITTGSAEKEYDGTPLTCHDYTWTVMSDNIPDGLIGNVTIKFSSAATITQPGIQKNAAFLDKVYDKNGNEITEYDFEAIIIPGTLTVISTDDNDGSDGASSGMINLNGGVKGGSDSEPIPVFTVQTPESGKVFLKVKSFGGTYYGNSSLTWGGAEDYTELIDEYIPYSYLSAFALKNGGYSAYPMMVYPLTDTNLVIPYYSAIDGNDHKLIASDDVMHGAYWDFSEPNRTYFIYSMSDIENAKLPDEYIALEADYFEFVKGQYCEIDNETLEFMNGIIAENGFDANDPLIIDKVATFIQNSAKYTMDYNAALDSSSNIAIDFFNYKEGICSHYSTAATMLYRALGIPARYTIGYSAYAKAGYTTVYSSMAHAWVEVYVSGFGWMPVEVTGTSTDQSEELDERKGEYVIRPEYLYKEYDGEPLEATNNVILSDALQRYLENQGYTCEAGVEGSQVDVGVGTSIIAWYRFKDEKGNIVTDKVISALNIETEPGKLVVTENIVEVFVTSVQQNYNATPLSLSSAYCYTLTSGFEVEMTLNVSLTDVGRFTADDINYSLDTVATYTIWRTEGNNRIEDVTENYKLVIADFVGQYDYELIRVDPHMITLQSGSKTKEYDESEPVLTCYEFTIISGSLLEGHKIEVVGGTSLSSVGKKANMLEYLITDENGRDVTDNYAIDSRYGELIITE